MHRIPPRKLIIFSSLVTAALFILFLNLIKIKGGSAAGYLVQVHGAEKASLFGVFFLIALLTGILIFMTVIYKQRYRY